MSSVKHAAQNHNAELNLQSTPGRGTTVTVALPDRKSLDGVVRDVPFDYAGGFQPVLMELSDALPYGAFRARHID